MGKTINLGLLTITLPGKLIDPLQDAPPGIEVPRRNFQVPAVQKEGKPLRGKKLLKAMDKEAAEARHRRGGTEVG